MVEKYYSEHTKKYYDTKEACLAAEKEFEEKKTAELKKKEAREKRAKEVEEAYKKYVELVEAFIKDYGYYVEYKTSSSDPMIRLFDAMLDWRF